MSPRHVTSGPTVFDTQSGSVILLLNPGDVQISRAGGGNEAVTAGYVDPSTLHADVDDVAPKADDAIVEPPGTPLAGTAVGLGAGDGALLMSGATQSLRVTDVATAIVMVLTISPPSIRFLNTHVQTQPASTPCSNRLTSGDIGRSSYLVYLNQ